MAQEWKRGDYTISTDPKRLDLKTIHDYLSNQSYWAPGIPMETVQRSIQNSLPFGLYHKDKMAGFGRVITDYATFGYIGDIFVLDEHRGQGLSKWMVELMLAHPDLQGFRRWILLTRDAQGLYKRFGFVMPLNPERYMERWTPDVYQRV
jgi:GNAT superfamily N-acetyltransferase